MIFPLHSITGQNECLFEQIRTGVIAVNVSFRDTDLQQICHVSHHSN